MRMFSLPFSGSIIFGDVIVRCIVDVFWDRFGVGWRVEKVLVG